MKLFCNADHGPRPGHVSVHDFTAREVERIVYVIQAMYADALCNPDDGEKELLGTDPYVMQQPCLKQRLDWSREIEMYGEWTDENVEARRLASTGSRT